MLRALLLLLALTGLLVVASTVTPVGYWYATRLAGEWNDPKGDILIVLGAGGEDQGLLELGSYYRCVYAVLAWREGGIRRVVISGKGVGEAMRAYIVASGVPGEAVTVEGESRNTHENAEFTARMLAPEPGSKVLLTSDYHMYRAHRAFAKAGMKVLPRPVPDVRKRWQSWMRRWPLMLELGMETVKIGYYRWKGWI